MGKATPPPDVKYFTGVLTSHPDVAAQIQERLAKRFGEVDLRSDSFPFDSTRYSEGSHLLSVTANSSVGQGRANETINVDNSAPSIQIAAPQNNAVVGTSFTYQYTAQDARSGVKRVDTAVDGLTSETETLGTPQAST